MNWAEIVYGLALVGMGVVTGRLVFGQGSPTWEKAVNRGRQEGYNQRIVEGLDEKERT